MRPGRTDLMAGPPITSDVVAQRALDALFDILRGALDLLRFTFRLEALVTGDIACSLFGVAGNLIASGV
jgi:hypothetical protein